MITSDMTSQAIEQSSAFGMPALGRGRVSVRAVPMTTGDVWAVDAPKTALEGTAVCGYSHITAAVVNGAFPGTSAWSPPI